MRHYGVGAVLLISCALAGWRAHAEATLFSAHGERIHRRTRQLVPLLRHLRRADADQLRMATELVRPDVDDAKSYHKDYDGLLQAVFDEVLFIHSEHKTVLQTAACAEIIDDEALMLRSIARSTKTLVGLQANAQTPIAYCAPANKDDEGVTTTPFPSALTVVSKQNTNAERIALARLFFDARSTPRVTNECAIDAKCATIYKWKPAKIEQWTSNRSNIVTTTGDVLVPSGCTCVINALGAGLADLPVIVF